MAAVVVGSGSGARVGVTIPNPRDLCARIGGLTVLHSWGQALTHHRHLHCVVPGSGIAPDGSRWIAGRPGFFLPVKTLARLFRRLYLKRLAVVLVAGDLGFFFDLTPLTDPVAFVTQLAAMGRCAEVVYAKKPFVGPVQVLGHLSRYIHRVAIPKVNGAGGETSHAQNQTYAAHLDDLRERYELLDAQAMLELTGSRYYRSGLYAPGTDMLQPAGYVRGLANGLSRVARICENTPVTGFRRSGTHWQVTTESGTVTAPKLVMANNGQLESFGFQRGRLIYVFMFASMTKELSPDALARLGGQPRSGITPSNPVGTTMRRIDTGQGGDRIVTRTCAEFRPGMASSEHEMRRATSVMRRKLDGRFSA